MSSTQRPIYQCETAQAALDSLCHWFYEDRLSAEGCEPVLAANLPPALRDLLVHNEHMTSKLEAYHRAQPVLRMLHERRDGNLYGRNIELVVPHEHVVEFGIVRIDLNYTPDAVREQILEKTIPLGDILVQGNVLRRIEPRWYFTFSPDSALAAHFPHHAGDLLAGRVGVIFCDGEPAIELLEVVTATKAPQS